MFNSIKKISNFLLAGLMVSSALVSCKKDKNEDPGGGTGPLANSLVSKIGQDADLNYIKDAIGIAGLSDTLSKAGEFTFFAPVDEALDSLGIDLKDPSLTKEDVNETLRYHIAKGIYRSGDVPANADNIKLLTINTPADSIFVTKTSTGSIYVNGVKVDDSKKDITVENGVIHKLVNNKASNEFGFLYFPDNNNVYDLLKNYQTGTFDSIVKMIDRAATVDNTLIPTLRNQVVTAAIPINQALIPFIQAFGGNINNISPNLLSNILKNHVVAGRKYLINFAIAEAAGGATAVNGKKLRYGLASLGATQFPALYIVSDKRVPIIFPDYMCRNGVIQVIYGVILEQ